MNTEKTHEYIVSIILNLLSSLMWAFISWLITLIPLRTIENVYGKTIVIFLICIISISLYIYFNNKFFYVKWDFKIKSNIYKLELKNNAEGVFTHQYVANITKKSNGVLKGTYDWRDAKNIKTVTVDSKHNRYTVSYKSPIDRDYTKCSNSNGTSILPNDKKILDYCIEYEEGTLKRKDDIENTIEVEFDYDKNTLDKNFKAGIKQPVGDLTLLLSVPDNLLKNVFFYAETFCGRKYIIKNKHRLKKMKDVNGNTYYMKHIKKPKLFCQYIIEWEWV